MTASSTLPSRPGTAPAARPGPLGRLADLTFRHRIGRHIEILNVQTLTALAAAASAVCRRCVGSRADHQST